MKVVRGPFTSLLVILVLCGAIYGVPSLLIARGNASARNAVRRVYEASREGYQEAPLPSEALATLREWDATYGRPTAFEIVSAYTQALGRPSEVKVRTTRGKAVYLETLSLGDGLSVYAAHGHDAKGRDE